MRKGVPFLFTQNNSRFPPQKTTKNFADSIPGMLGLRGEGEGRGIRGRVGVGGPMFHVEHIAQNQVPPTVEHVYYVEHLVPQLYTAQSWPLGSTQKAPTL